jgi:uncharacterized protein with HEPN domain
MREVDHTIRDILETIERVEAKVAGKSFDEFPPLEAAIQAIAAGRGH